MPKTKDNRDTVTVLETLRTIVMTGEGFHAEGRPCSSGVELVGIYGAREAYEFFPHNVRWLGEALVEMKCIDPPVVASADRAASCANVPHVFLAHWYYPYEVLLAGCRLWNEKQRRASKKKKVTKKK